MFADERRRLWLRALTSAGLLGTGLLVLAGCVFHNGPPNPDPHNQRLNQLANDPIFAQLPAGATQTSKQLIPVHPGPAAFGGGARGWEGPAVVLTFTTDQPIGDVYAFFAHRAAVTGWTPNGQRTGWVT